MATWASSLDVLKDLDKLSQFSVGFKSPDIPIVSYSSYGRGNCIDRECSPPPSPLFHTNDETFQSSALRFPPTAGRGDRIVALNRHRHKNSLQQQLRMAMGPGYSNELIEEYIRGETSSEQSSEAGQFDDDIEDVICEGTASCNIIYDSSSSNTANEKLIQNGACDKMVKPQCDSSDDMLTLESDTSSELLVETDMSTESTLQRDCSLRESILKTDHVTEKSHLTNTSSEINTKKDSESAGFEVLSQQKKPRSNRNALLNSLANFKSSVKVRDENMFPDKTLDKENIKSSMEVWNINMSPEKTESSNSHYESTIKVQKKDISAEKTVYGRANFKSSMNVQNENVSPEKIQNGSFYYKSSVTSYDNNFKKKNKTSPSAQVSGGCLDTKPLYVQALDADFVLKEEDFPPL